MTQEDKELLLSLLKKADEEGLVHIYDSNQDDFKITWIFLDDEIFIKISKII